MHTVPFQWIIGKIRSEHCICDYGQQTETGETWKVDENGWFEYRSAQNWTLFRTLAVCASWRNISVEIPPKRSLNSSKIAQNSVKITQVCYQTVHQLILPQTKPFSMKNVRWSTKLPVLSWKSLVFQWYLLYYSDHCSDQYFEKALGI
jgi:hypothetical protein